MRQTFAYNTTVTWKGEHWGRIRMGNGPEMDFSAPPDSHGHPGVLTPEDAFVASVNACIMMMFLWATKRYKINLISYNCYAEATKMVELDQTEIFTQVNLRPLIQVSAGGEDKEIIVKRVKNALQSAQKYSLVANSIKSEIVLEPHIEII